MRSSSSVAAERAPSEMAAAAGRRPGLRLRAAIVMLLLVPAVTLVAVWGDFLEGGNGLAP